MLRVRLRPGVTAVMQSDSGSKSRRRLSRNRRLCWNESGSLAPSRTWRLESTPSPSPTRPPGPAGSFQVRGPAGKPRPGVEGNRGPRRAGRPPPRDSRRDLNWPGGPASSQLELCGISAPAALQRRGGDSTRSQLARGQLSLAGPAGFRGPAVSSSCESAAAG